MPRQRRPMSSGVSHMPLYAELEISLHSRAPGEFEVEFRFNQPGSDADVRLGGGQPARLQLDVAQLRLLAQTPKQYALNLTQAFFADPEVRAAFTQARASSQALNVVLRVRLLVGPSAPQLHSVIWELLLDPETRAPLFNGEKLVFSRYLSSADWRPVLPRPKAALRALVVVANPANLNEYQGLAPINAAAEFELAAEGLKDIATTHLGGTPGALAASLENLAAALRRDTPDILYLVCHGALLDEEPYLWLEDPGRQAAVTPGSDLAQRIQELSQPPLLVILAACQSAERADAGNSRQALVPQLAQAGVPALVAMQGRISMQTAAGFMTAFFQALQQDGQIDRAAAVGRGQVRQHPDYWMPALYTRLKSGALYTRPAPEAAALEAAGRRRTMRLRFAALLLVLALLAAAGAWALYYPPPMGPGFNVAVAEFSVLDDQGRLRTSPEGEKISQALFENIEAELNRLPSVLATSYNLRGPELIGPVKGGGTDAERSQQAARLARRHNASVLVYGVITNQGGRSQVALAYTVAPGLGFEYGSEVIGADRLGSRVPADLSLAPEELLALNADLYGRVSALTQLVIGLRYFYLGEYERAALEFQTATLIDEWKDNAGKEVAYMLLGSARLRARDPNDPEQSDVARALAAFERAREIDPTYARAYLGLGSATLQLATRFNPQQELKLLEGRDWLLTALTLPGQSPQEYIPVKAAYELGGAHLLGALQGYSSFSKDEARRNYALVVDAYQDAGRPVELAWHAGHAYAQLGYMAGDEKDFPGMAAACNQARKTLEQIGGQGAALSIAIAKTWGCLAHAEELQGHTGPAIDYYRQAIEVAAPLPTPQELPVWQEHLEQLEEGG